MNPALNLEVQDISEFAPDFLNPNSGNDFDAVQQHVVQE